MRYAILCVLLVAALAPTADAQSRSCRLADDPVERAIGQKVKELGGGEYCQVRTYDAHDDFDGDKVDDFLVTFNVEGPEGGGNHVKSFLLVFLSTRAQGAPPFEAAVGERGAFAPTGIASAGKHIIVRGQKCWLTMRSVARRAPTESVSRSIPNVVSGG
jgi:hypothetical protein